MEGAVRVAYEIIRSLKGVPSLISCPECLEYVLLGIQGREAE